jgi:hypothetical protein
MKNILYSTVISLVFLSNTYGQYSTYYNYNVNQKVNANINQNLNVSGTIFENKTITSIDYGALSLANAQREAIRLENAKYADEQQKHISLEVASNPVKAYDYGYANNFSLKGKEAKSFGFKHFSVSYVIPNNTLFVPAGAGRFENVSIDGITTEIIINGPAYNTNKTVMDIEKFAKMDSTKVGQLNKGADGNEIFVHKKDLNRATVFGIKGFKSTLIWEDEYQNTITDNYNAYNPSEGNGIFYSVKVRTYGNKSEVNFEKLEGRRFYLRQLIEKVISTAVVYDMKY